MNKAQFRPRLFLVGLLLNGTVSILFQFSVILGLLFCLGGNIPLFVAFTLTYFIGMAFGIFTIFQSTKFNRESFLLNQFFHSVAGLLALPIVFGILTLGLRFSIPLFVLKGTLWTLGLFFALLFGFTIGRPVRMAPPIMQSLNWTPVKMEWVLSLQFIGCFLGSVAYPLIIFPNLHFFRTVSANELCALGLIALFVWLFGKRPKNWAIGVFAVLLVGATLLFLFTRPLERLLMDLTKNAIVTGLVNPALGRYL